MPDNFYLIRQLANRAKSFHQLTGISQAQLASAIGMSDGNYSRFLAGKKGIGSESTCLLLKFTNMSVAKAIATFNKAPTSRVMELQEQGKHLQFDNDGWTPGTGDRAQGVDPNNSGGIDNTPDASTEGGPVWDQDLIDTLRETRGYHRKAVRAINAYINAAKVNAGMTTPTGVAQKFTRFSMLDDVTDSDSVKDLVTAIAGLKDSVRRQLVALINDKFPNSR